jgi:hypothetical protein
LIDLSLLLLGLGFVSLLSRIISASLLSVVFIARAVAIWSLHGESMPVERLIISVDVTLLLLTVAATWAECVESRLQKAGSRRGRKKIVASVDRESNGFSD